MSEVIRAPGVDDPTLRWGKSLLWLNFSAKEKTMDRVAEEFKRWSKILSEFNHCKVIDPWKKEERFMIASIDNVPWSDSLRAQYNEASNKIGYVDKQTKGIRMDIDFLPDIVSEEMAVELMSNHSHVSRVSSEQRSPGHISYWKGNTFTLCLRNEDLGTIAIDSKLWRDFLQRIITGAMVGL